MSGWHMRRGIETKWSGRHKEKGKFYMGKGGKVCQENEKINLHGLAQGSESLRIVMD